MMKRKIGYRSPDGHGHGWYINKRHWDNSTTMQITTTAQPYGYPASKVPVPPRLLRIWDGAAVGCNMSMASHPWKGGNQTRENGCRVFNNCRLLAVNSNIQLI